MPLTKKGQKIYGSMLDEYGQRRGKGVFYASKNKGIIKGVGGGERHMPVMHAIEGAGGGMSDSENRMVNHRGRRIGNHGPPKATNDGKDLGKNAKNKISGPAGLLTKPQSPSAHCQSPNRKGYK
jgi:hypothetical protein